MQDDETIKAYNEQVGEYAQLVEQEKPSGSLTRFVNVLPENGRALDFGCGPGNSAAFMQSSGLKVDAMDASEEMASLARERYGVAVRVGTFSDLDTESEYDGVWANFSLLHAPRSEFPDHLQNINRALKPKGHFHIGMKLGSGERRDRLGRFYTYYSLEELKTHLEKAGFRLLSTKTGEERGLAGDIDPFAVILSQKS